MVVLIAIAVLARLEPAQRGANIVRLVSTVLLASLIAVVAADRFLGSALTLAARATIDLTSAIIASFAAGGVAMSAVIYAVDDSSFSFRATAGGIIVIALLFVGVPLFLGRARAFNDLASPSTRLPRAKILASSDELPILFTTQERIYCLSSRDENAATPAIAIFKWDQVTSVLPPVDQ
jgi:hypothetical protein